MRRYSGELAKPLEPIRSFGMAQSEMRNATLKDNLTRGLSVKFN